MRKWLRVLICLLLVCCILVNLSPLRAKATGAGLAGVIASASSVTVSAPLAVGASLIALGVMADNINPLVFENVVNAAVDSLSAAGQWVKDGAVELLRTVDEAGNAMYYAAGDMLETIRSGLFSSGLVEQIAYGSEFTVSGSVVGAATFTCDVPFAMVWDTCGSDASWWFFSNQPGTIFYKSVSGSTGSMKMSATSVVPGLYVTGWISYHGDTSAWDIPFLGHHKNSTCSPFIDHYNWAYPLLSSLVGSTTTSYDLSLGQISTVPVDGTSARSWAGVDVADRNGLYVKYNNDPEPPDDNNGHWFWKLALPVTAATLLAMSQADEWSGETPKEFDDYTTNTEFEILDRPEIDGYQGIELAPITNPNPNPDVNPDTGEGADPTEPGEPTEPSEDESTGSDSETNWFEKIWRSIVELPNSFKTWFEDLKKGIEELPSKFSQWASDTISAIQNLPQAFANLFADVVAAIQSVPQTIKDFFTPKAPDNHDKFALADLSKFFPFCIPFDLYDFFTLLNADPVAPVLSWEIKDLAGQTYSLDVDLSQWDSVALLFRRLQLFLFITGLAAASRKFIKW